MAERFDRSTGAMIRRDRNHPSVAIWGLINETRDGPVFRQAVAFLPQLRALDPTRLALLASGRWDSQPLIGSVSNPASTQWEHVWGVEAPGAPAVSSAWSREAAGHVEHAGDAHAYPSVPQSRDAERVASRLCWKSADGAGSGGPIGYGADRGLASPPRGRPQDCGEQVGDLAGIGLVPAGSAPAARLVADPIGTLAAGRTAV